VGRVGITEARSAFRGLVNQAVPVQNQTRVHQLLDSVVFSAEPILRGLEHFEVRYGSGAPTVTSFPQEGYGLYIDEAADAVYVVLHWQDEFYILGGSSSGSVPAHTHDHTTDLTNVGTNTHAQIDTHIADATIHFTEASIDHTAIQNIGTNTHAQIDTHIADSTIHFTEGSIDHGSISGLSDDDHDIYLLADGTRELTGDWGLGNTYGITEIPFLDFYDSYAGAHQEGRMHWDDDDGCINIGMKGGNVELQTGLELLIQCRNITGSQIDDGKLVKITGATGNKPKIELADAANPWSGYSAVGLATEDVGNNSNGYVTTNGLVRGIDTSAWSEGDALYLDNATPGELTNVYPTSPEVVTHVGVVVRSHATEGEILCQIVTVPPMTLLADTFGTPSSDGEFYSWDTGNSRFQLDNTGDYLLRDEWLENGFDDASDTALAWDDGSLTLTLSPAVTSFDYHYAGYKYTETGNLSATITDTEGLWVFYIGSGGAASLSTIHNPSYEQVEDAILNQCIVAYVYWDAANNDGRLMDERHGSIMGRGTHHYLHELFGSQYLDGMTIGDITTDQNGNSDSHAQFSITSGEFYDEDLEHETLAHASTDTWECYYVDGSGYVRWVDCEATFPVYAIGGVIAYNNAGTLTAVTSNKYCLYHVFATNIKDDAGGDYYPVVTPGTAEYNTKAEAQDAASTEIQGIDFGEWPTEEIIPLWTVIYHHGAAMTNGVEAAIQSTEGGDDAVDWRFTTISGSSTSVNDHGALSGLADDDHPLYLLASDATDRATFATNWTDLTDTGDTTLHGHDVTGLTNWPTIDYSYVSGNDAATDVTAAELEELTDGSTTTKHDHDVTGLTNWPTIDYAYVSGNDAGTDISAAELEELSDGSSTSLHTHSGLTPGAHAASHENGGSDEIDLSGLSGTSADLATHAALTTAHGSTGDVVGDTDLTNAINAIVYATISGNDAGTDVSAAELEELSDGSTTTLHDHDVTGLTNWPTIDYSYVSGNDAATDVTAAQLEELSDGSDTDLHTHSQDGIDTSAIHDDTAGEIHALTDKATLDSGDEIMIEDFSASWAKKRCQVSDLVGLYNAVSGDEGHTTVYYGVVGVYSTAYVTPGRIEVANNTGSTLNKGDVCYISGDDSGTPEVTLADADAAATATGELVMITDSTISNGADGYATKWGLVTGLSGFTANTVQFLSTTAGDTTETAPSGSGDIVRVVGYSRLTTSILFDPGATWVEIT